MTSPPPKITLTCPATEIYRDTRPAAGMGFQLPLDGRPDLDTLRTTSIVPRVDLNALMFKDGKTAGPCQPGKNGDTASASKYDAGLRTSESHGEPPVER